MTETTQRYSLWSRIFLAGPFTFICAFMVMIGSSAYIPQGNAQLDNIAIPLVLFPAVWAVLFFYSSLSQRLGRVFFVQCALFFSHAALVVFQLNSVAS